MKPRHNDPTARLVPTLDGEGWIMYGARDKLDRLLAMFFTSDAAQSALYYRTMATYQSLNADNAGDVAAFADVLEKYLNDYLRKYFDDKISINVYTTSLDGTIKDVHELNNEGAVGIKLDIQYIERDEYITFNKALTYKDGIFSYVLSKFNGE